MEESAFAMLSASLTASIWAMAGGLAWMLIFYCAIPLMAKWNTFGLMSREAATRAATLRMLSELRSPPAVPVYWD